MAKRPADYSERRSDGYTEPLELYVLGTSHVSEASAKHVRRVLDAVRPQSVVVEVRLNVDGNWYQVQYRHVTIWDEFHTPPFLTSEGALVYEKHTRGKVDVCQSHKYHKFSSGLRPVATPLAFRACILFRWRILSNRVPDMCDRCSTQWLPNTTVQ